MEESLQKQQEETKRKEFTIEKLERLNIHQKKIIKSYKTSDIKYRGRFELQQTNLITAPRFEVILEILKKQDARIKQLEELNKSQLNNQ